MTATSILRRRLSAVAGLALDASVAGFSKLVLPHRGMRCRGASSTAASVLRRRLSVVAVLARRVSIAGFSNEPALLPPSAVWGCNCDRSPFLWLRLCPIAVLSMAGNEVCARYRGATRRPLRDVPCGARYRRRRRGWTSFHFITSAASMGDSLLHAGVPQHSNVRPSGLGYSCTMVCDGEKSALALSLQRCFCRLPLTDGSCGSVRQTFVPERMSARGAGTQPLANNQLIGSVCGAQGRA